MKHLSEASSDTLRALCIDAGVPISKNQAFVLTAYVDVLISKNEQINLTRITDEASALRLHVLDSLVASGEVNTAPRGMLLDLGSGGGFPGVPLCVVCERVGDLLDSVKKKASAVDEILGLVGLDDRIHSVGERAEAWAQAHPGEYAVVVARAVAPLASLVELAAPLLCQDGRLVALKGAPEPEELLQGARAAEIVGLREASQRHLVLPEGGEYRTIVAYEKTGTGSMKLPRRIGLAQKKPLG